MAVIIDNFEPEALSSPGHRLTDLTQANNTQSFSLGPTTEKGSILSL